MKFLLVSEPNSNGIKKGISKIYPSHFTDSVPWTIFFIRESALSSSASNNGPSCKLVIIVRTVLF